MTGCKGDCMDSNNKATLNMYFLLDTSGSMVGEKLAQLNRCMGDLIPKLKNAAYEEAVNLVIRIMTFGGAGIDWRNGTTAERGVLIEDFIWSDIKEVQGPTPMTSAIKKLTDAIKQEYLGNNPLLKPVVILVTDGCNTDNDKDFNVVCDRIKNKLGCEITRIVIAIGNDVDNRELSAFASNGSLGTNKPYIFNVANSIHMAELIQSVSVGSVVDAGSHSTQIIDSMCKEQDTDCRTYSFVERIPDEDDDWL